MADSLSKGNTILSTPILANTTDLTKINLTEIQLKNFLFNSKCATNTSEKSFLASLIGLKRTTLLYNASAHGWNQDDFHSRCDNKGSTITLLKILGGDCIGGYTTL